LTEIQNHGRKKLATTKTKREKDLYLWGLLSRDLEDVDKGRPYPTSVSCLWDREIQQRTKVDLPIHTYLLYY